MPEWMPTNVFSRHKARVIPEKAWNERKAEILAEYDKGMGKHGAKLAYDWIHAQNDPEFLPT